MTDRVKGFTVVLEREIREDDVEIIKHACFVAGKIGREQLSILDKFNADPYNWQGS